MTRERINQVKESAIINEFIAVFAAKKGFEPAGGISAS